MTDNAAPNTNPAPSVDGSRLANVPGTVPSSIPQNTIPKVGPSGTVVASSILDNGLIVTITKADDIFAFELLSPTGSLSFKAYDPLVGTAGAVIASGKNLYLRGDTDVTLFANGGKVKLFASVAINVGASVSVHANNAAALAAGLVAGDLYRTGADPDPICVVH